MNKLRNKNRLQVHPKTTTARSSVPPASRRSPLLPRRKTITEAPVPEVIHEDNSTEINDAVSEGDNVTEAMLTETSTAASIKHEETRGLSSLLAPRRRIAPKRQLIAQN